MLFKWILMAVVFFFVTRFLQRLTTPSSMRSEGWFARRPRAKERADKYPDAIDADFEELDDKK
jgi:uncharacterized protein HemY